MQKNSKIFFLTVLFFGIFGLAKSSMAATRYVDGSVSSSGNGQSWATAWKTLGNITGLSAGDIVYISGGANGGAGLTYSGSTLTPTAGNSGSGRITYQIGQDSAHNGVATFTTTDFITNNYVNIIGDAGDGVQHFVWTTDNDFATNLSHYRISYVNLGQRNNVFYQNGGTDIEVDHIFVHKLTNADRDNVAYFDVIGATYGVNKIHDNVFEIPYEADGMGEDGFQSGCEGTDFYNNVFRGYHVANLANSQHGDGIQPLGSQYLRIYNNTFIDIVSYGIFLEAYYGDFTHIRVYNNVFYKTTSSINGGSDTGGITIGPGGVNGRTYSDIVVANNTIADNGIWDCARIGTNGSSGTYINAYAYNNICINGGGLSIDNTWTAANNISTTGAGHFVSYSAYGASNDFHLSVGDSTFKDHGTNLSSLTDMPAYNGVSWPYDRDGNTRSGTWDIGAYEYQSGGSDTTPPACPVNLTVQ